jgi:hypothetical protein
MRDWWKLHAWHFLEALPKLADFSLTFFLSAAPPPPPPNVTGIWIWRLRMPQSSTYDSFSPVHPQNCWQFVPLHSLEWNAPTHSFIGQLIEEGRQTLPHKTFGICRFVKNMRVQLFPAHLLRNKPQHMNHVMTLQGNMRISWAPAFLSSVVCVTTWDERLTLSNPCFAVWGPQPATTAAVSQRELHFLSTHAVEPELITTSSGLSWIESRYNQVFI